MAHEVIQGEAGAVIQNLDRKPALCLTDPPYGIKMDKGFEGFGGFGTPIARRRYETDDWDATRPDKAVFDAILSRCASALIFGGDFFADLLPQGNHWIVWDKLNTMPSFGDCELIWTNVDRNSVKKVTRQYNGLLGKEKERYHPTQKPLDLIRELVRTYSDVGDLVIDPFCGSGTTGVACVIEGRNFIGIEKDAHYCEVARARIKRASGIAADIPKRVREYAPTPLFEAVA